MEIDIRYIRRIKILFKDSYLISTENSVFEQRCIVCAKLNENSNHLFIFYFFFLSIFFFVLGLRRAHFLCERREIISTIIRWVRYHGYFLSPCDWMRSTQPNNEEKNTINFKTFDMLYWNEFSRKTILQAPFFFGCCSFLPSHLIHIYFSFYISICPLLFLSLSISISLCCCCPRSCCGLSDMVPFGRDVTTCSQT